MPMQLMDSLVFSLRVDEPAASKVRIMDSSSRRLSDVRCSITVEVSDRVVKLTGGVLFVLFGHPVDRTTRGRDAKRRAGGRRC